VARLDYSADEKDLEREFGRFGPIERVSLSSLFSENDHADRPGQIRIIRDTHAHEKGNKKQKPHRGYGFVVFEREKDMRGNAATLIPTPSSRRLPDPTPGHPWPSSLPVLSPYSFFHPHVLP
jgi:hypothetical protein